MMKKFLIAVAALAVLLSPVWFDGFIASLKGIQEFPEPWKVLEPGMPPETRPRIEIVTEGGGKNRAWGSCSTCE